MSEAEKYVTAEFERQATAATEKFEEAVQTEGPLGVVTAFGELVTGFGHATGEFGDGLGEVLEESAQKSFGSEEFGSGFFPELGETFMAVIGEATEGIAEASAGVGEAAAVAVGGAITAVGSIGEHAFGAVSELAQGDVGDAFENVWAIAGDVKDLAGTAVDVVGAGVSAAGELVEGVGGVARELGEGAVEMVVGGAGDIADLAGDAWDAVFD